MVQTSYDIVKGHGGMITAEKKENEFTESPSLYQ
jgi:hypothetical protein